MNPETIKSKFFTGNSFIVIPAILAFATFYIFFHMPPGNFPRNQVITILPGQSLQQITDTLYEEHVIRSPFVFRFTVIVMGGEKKVVAGDYLLDRAIGPIDLSYRLIRGDFHLDSQKITIPEGWSSFEIADVLEDTLVNFDKKYFEELAKKEEGYLFPDTYFLSATAKPEAVVSLMRKNFDKRIVSVPGISTTTRSLKDIIIMASILEGEAKTTDDRRVIAGILWKRISMGMALQVDAPFAYLSGKNGDDVRPEDLKIDSPYNTYKYRGLPPGPIGNPGVDSIFASLNPVKSSYLYFIATKDGKVYYAKTFEEHKQNIERYL